jgi:hypothetical protein
MDLKFNALFKTIRNLQAFLCPELERKQYLHDWLRAAELLASVCWRESVTDAVGSELHC